MGKGWLRQIFFSAQMWSLRKCGNSIVGPCCKHAPWCYIFFGHRTNLSFCLVIPYLDPLSLITRRLHQTASFLSLILYHPNLRSPLVLSSGCLLIALSVAVLLSCTIHRPTKQCYCRLGLCPLASVALPAQSCLWVYKLYYYSTWTL